MNFVTVQKYEILIHFLSVCSGPGFTKILKLMFKLRHIISVFVSHEIMLKLVFSKVISGENKLKLSLYVSKHFIG